jgi:alpha-L-rhamnosidase
MKNYIPACIYALLFLSSLAISCKRADWQPSPAKQPYAYVSGSFSGTTVPESPDPLVAYRWTNPKATDDLEIYTLKPVAVSCDNPRSFENLQSATGKSPRITIRGTGSIRVDFGQVNAAWLEFDSEDLQGRVEMSISEYNKPAVVNDGAQHRFKTSTPVRYGNTYRLELNNMLYEGVRYGWIHVRTFEKAWHISHIRLVCQIKPTNYKGSFSCDDTLLTRIWYTGAYGVKLNLLKDYFGAILMERSDQFSWTGDAYTSQAATLVAFGNYDFILTNLNHTANQNNGILSYSLYWIQSLIDYYHYTGDSATLVHYIPNARGKLDEAYKVYGTNPPLGYYGSDERLGAMFENTNCAESENAYKMLSIESWLHFADAMHQIGRTGIEDIYRSHAMEKIALLKKDKDWFRSFGLHAAADAINADFSTRGEQQEMYKKEFCDRVNRISLSPFNQYFIIHALARMGKYDDALSIIRDHWGGMIRYGGTAFFELYRPSWNQVLGYNDAPPNNQTGYTSMCHPWGGGVISWLTEQVLGIRPVQPGFSSCEIVPHLGRTLTRVEGTVPTPHGVIRASFNTRTGKCSITVPAGVTAKIGLPRVEKTIRSISCNGNIVWNGKYTTVNGIAGASEDSNYVYLTGVQPGSYSIVISYSGTTPAYQELPWIYPVDHIITDTSTGGNWGGKYGTSGYVLFAYDNQQKDIRKLPAFVQSLTCRLNHQVQWAMNSDESRAPSASPDNSFPRNAGAIVTQNAIPCLQTMTVDIKLKPEHACRVALYFLDWDNSHRKVAIEMFDLNDLKLLAPVQVVADYARGKYLIYNLTRSARFRINMINEPNATLSAVFFDRD